MQTGPRAAYCVGPKCCGAMNRRISTIVVVVVLYVAGFTISTTSVLTVSSIGQGTLVQVQEERLASVFHASPDQ
jgi:hypothetical protein